MENQVTTFTELIGLRDPVALYLDEMMCEEDLLKEFSFKSEKSQNLIYAFIATNWSLADLGSYEDFYCILIKERPIYQSDFDLIKDSYFDFMEKLLVKENINIP